MSSQAPEGRQGLSYGVIPKPRAFIGGVKDLPWNDRYYGRSFAPPEKRLRPG